MDPDTLVAAHPHYRRKGSDLYFFLSDRPCHSLDPAEAELWEAISAEPVLLKNVVAPSAVESLARAGLIETIEPVAAENRRRILVIEPHCDDAALSIGATMWKMRGDVEFTLLTLASRSNYTSNFHLRREFFNRDEITKIRTAEGALFVRHIGGHYRCAELTEATLRYRDDDWDLDYFKSHEVAIAIHNNRQADDAVLALWANRLDEFLSGSSFDEIWIPLGAGSHSDHDLARNASLQVLMTKSSTPRVRIYQDVPYDTQFKEHVERILTNLRSTGARLTAWPQDVTETFPKKLSLLGIFASQFKVSAIEPRVLESAGDEIDASRIEHLWTLDAFPRELDRNEMWIGAPKVAQVAAKLTNLRKGATRARRVAIYAISPSGDWNHDLDRLAELFPSAKFIVYAGPKVFADFQAVDDRRVELKKLNARTAVWVKAALREFGTSHRIIIAGGAVGKARKLAAPWVIGGKIIVEEMSHLIKALKL